MSRPVETRTAADELALETPISGQGCPTWEDFVEGQRLACATGWKTSAFLMLIVGCTGIPMACSFPSPAQSAAYLAGHVAVIGVLVGIGTIFARWRRDQLGRRAGQRQPAFRDVIVKEGQIEYRYLAGAETYAWTDFSQYRCSDRLIVLLESGPLVVFHVLPREMFGSATDWERLRGLVARKLPCR